MLPVLLFSGDLHYDFIGSVRLNAYASDIPNLPRVSALLHPGDITQDSLPAEDAGVQVYMDSLGVEWYSAIGNHDTYDRTGDEAADALGLPGKNQSHNLGFVQLIILGPDAHTGSRIVLSQATLTYLDDQLTACAPRPAVIMCHAALYDSVVQTPGGPGENASDIQPWFVIGLDEANAFNEVRDQPVRDVLAAHDNAFMWLSGHTHNPIHNPTLWTSVDLGGHRIICGNGSALVWTKPPHPPWEDRYLSRLVSAVIYVLRDRVEVRYRDHLNRKATTGPNDERLSIIYYDDGLLVHERRTA